MAEEEREDVKSEVEEKATTDAVVDEEVMDAGTVAEETKDVEIADESPVEEEVCEDEVSCLEAKLAETEQKMAEYLDGWQRCQATFTNFRRRTEAEQVSFRSVANAALLTRLLSVADDFTRAFQALPDDLAGQAWLDGIRLIQRKVDGILEAENVKPIEIESGDAFDPLYHQAILYQEVDGFEEGQIVAEVERGYILSERVLRPSSVVVAKAQAKASPKPPESEPAIDVEGEVVEEAVELVDADACCCEDKSGECCCEDNSGECGCGEHEPGECCRSDKA